MGYGAPPVPILHFPPSALEEVPPYLFYVSPPYEESRGREGAGAGGAKQTRHANAGMGTGIPQAPEGSPKDPHPVPNPEPQQHSPNHTRAGRTGGRGKAAITLTQTVVHAQQRNSICMEPKHYPTNLLKALQQRNRSNNARDMHCVRTVRRHELDPRTLKQDARNWHAGSTREA